MNTRLLRRAGSAAAALTVAGAAAVAALLLTEPAPSTAAGTAPGFAGQFGFPGSAFGSVAADAAWALQDAAYSLADIDPLTGGIVGGAGANQPYSIDAAVTHDLMEQGLLAFDGDDLAQQARMEAETRRLAEEARRRREGEPRVAFRSVGHLGVPQAHELKTLRCGSDGGHRARILAADAWEIMCEAARADGVALPVSSAFRDPQHQARLFRSAVARYGSERAARRWVAYSDGTTCHSRHCSGVAIDVALRSGASATSHSWLHTVVGCADGAGSVAMGRTSCRSGEVPVKRMQLYGFVAPMDWEPWHLELGIPEGRVAGAGDCSPPSSLSVPEMIGAVWRCRLGQAGIDGAERERIVAEAVVVARCESNWNPNVVVFNGRYTRTPHPRTGLRYTAAGVFQFIDSSANRWVAGGYANVHDPIANIDGAARYFIAERRAGRPGAGWGPWACAMANDGFATASVLPGYPQGPAELPGWAWSY